MDDQPRSRSITRRRALQVATSSFLASSGLSASALAADGDSDPVDVFSVDSPRGNKRGIVRSANDQLQVVIETGAREHVAYSGTDYPIHPAWNEKGNRLAVSLSGQIHVFNPGGNRKQVTDGGTDSLPLFEDGDLIFHRGDEQLRVSEQSLDEDDSCGNCERVSFDLSRITDHPAVSEEAAATIRSYADRREVR